MSKALVIKADALVIGSGFGGAITAATLTDKGVAVTLLERGPWRDSIPVAAMGITQRSPLPRHRHFYTHFVRNVEANLAERLALPNLVINRNGLYELFLDRNLLAVCCSGVGGGSLGYTGLHHPPADPHYWHQRSERIDPREFEHHYQRFLQIMGSTRPDPAWKIPNHTAHMHQHNPLFAASAASWQPWMGLLFKKRSIEPDASSITQHSVGNRLPSEYRNEGLLGSYTGSKTTLDTACLSGAIQRGLVVRDCTEARYIARNSPLAGSRYAVHCYDHERKSPVVYHTDNLFLGAGTLNTLRLLFRSRDEQRSLSGMPLLGRGIATNADSISLWMRPDLEGDFSQGMPCHGPLAFRDGKDQAQFIQAGISGLEEIPMPAMIRRRLQKWLFITAMGADRNDGIAYWRNGRLRIQYSMRDSALHQHIHARFRQIRQHFGKPLLFSENLAATLHLLGGAPIHDDAKQGMINGAGEVHHHDGLFIVDATALPDAPGMPPSMTIAAWAYHVAEHFAAAHGMTGGNAAVSAGPDSHVNYSQKEPA